jgi:hypothetical protein
MITKSPEYLGTKGSKTVCKTVPDINGLAKKSLRALSLLRPLTVYYASDLLGFGLEMVDGQKAFGGKESYIT